MPEPNKKAEKPDLIATIDANFGRLKAYLGNSPLLAERMNPDDAKERQAALSKVALDVRELSGKGDKRKPESK